MTLKLDMEKTYDRLDRMPIRKCFLKFGFTNKWTE